MNTGSIPPPNPLSYEGQVVVPFINRTSMPQTTFNKFPVPTIWIDTLTKIPYILVNKELGVATWVPFGSGSGTLSTLTTPDAVVVVPTAGNINFLNGTGMNITGSGDSITFNVTGDFANLYTADSGTAAPSGNNLNILGGSTGLTTLGSGNTISLTGVLNVTHGGTGRNTLTTHGVLIGAGTSAVTISSSGTDGQLFVAQGVTVDPIFASSARADFAFTNTVAATPRTLTVSNSDNTSTSSSAKYVASVGGTSAGDASYVSTITGGQSWAIGPQTNASGTWKLSNSVNLGTNDCITADTAGNIQFPRSCAFGAYVSSNLTNVTGDGTNYIIIFDTEYFDRGSNYNNANGQFTAPDTGLYEFTCSPTIIGLAAGNTTSKLSFVVNGVVGYATNRGNFGVTADAGGILAFSISAIISLTAGDVVVVRLDVAGGTKIVGLNGLSGGGAITYFSGRLVA